MPRRRTLIPGAAPGLGCAVAAAGVRGPPASALEAVFRTASPTVTGPIRGGRHGWPFGAFYGDIGALGYVEEEYFIAGQALRFAPVGALRQDGRWSVEPTTPAPYDYEELYEGTILRERRSTRLDRPPVGNLAARAL